MKSSPAKKGSLSNFFSSLGKQATAGQKDRGIFSEKGKAEKKEMRKTGESKYQYDVRKRQETNKAKRASNKADAAYYGSDEDKAKNSEANRIKPKKEVVVNDPAKKEVVVNDPAKIEVKSKVNSKVVKNTKVNKEPQGRRVAPNRPDLNNSMIDPNKMDLESGSKSNEQILYAGYPGKPIIDMLGIENDILEKGRKKFSSWFNSLNEGEPKPEIRSGIRKKSPSKKRGYKMRKK